MRRLERRGAVVITAERGASFRNLGGGGFLIDAERREDYERLVGAATGSGRGSLQGVLHLWPADDDSLETFDGSNLTEAGPVSCRSLLYLVQALSQVEAYPPPRLWLVTRGAQPAGRPAEFGPIGQAPLWGLGRAIAAEHPEWRPRRIDLGARPGPAEAEVLWREIISDHEEPEVALREGARYVPHLVSFRPRNRVEGASAAIRADGTYLVTGGLGGLGLAVARWLVGQGARHLALLGRSKPSPEAHRIVNSLRSRGARIELVRADVANREDVALLLVNLRAGMPPLAGLIHAAGVLDDGPLVDMGWETFAAVLAPKVLGAWNLHELTSGDALDFFVMFSSAVSLVGSAGQGNYIAGNAFLDALAHQRRRLGLPALSINWGPWAEIGAATRPDRVARLKQEGIYALSTKRALAAFGLLLHQPDPQVAVMRLDAQSGSCTERRGDCDLTVEQADEGGRADAGDALRRTNGCHDAPLPFAGSWRQRDLLERHLREQLARLLRIDAEGIDARTPFRSFGLDSLRSLELRNRLEESLGLSLSVTLIWKYPTIELLAGRLGGLLGGEGLGQTDKPAVTVHAAARPGSTRIGELERLTECDAEHELLETLAAIEKDKSHGSELRKR
jgi:NAD(P)-dependent dehydrogenase (short-subunit alcohol dehydrogenase family)/acyl carrier protein